MGSNTHGNGHKECLHEVVHDSRNDFKQMFPHRIVRGIHVPNDGDPIAYLRAWAAFLAVKTVEVAYIAEDMAMDMDVSEDDDHAQSEHIQHTQRHLTKARAAAEAILHELQPGATVTHSVLDDIFNRVPMTPFVEVMQIQQATDHLANVVTAMLNRCTAHDHFGGTAA